MAIFEVHMALSKLQPKSHISVSKPYSQHRLAFQKPETLLHLASCAQL